MSWAPDMKERATLLLIFNYHSQYSLSIINRDGGIRLHSHEMVEDGSLQAERTAHRLMRTIK